MTPPIDIRADHLRIVQTVLRRHLPDGVRIWVFGSRATWVTKDSSDLDLALEGDTDIPPRSLSALEMAFEDSDLPFVVDIVDVNRIGERFRQIVAKQRVPLPMRRRAATSHPHAGGSARASGIDLKVAQHKLSVEWSRVRLGDTADLLTGFPFKSDRYVSDSAAPRLLRGDNIAQGHLRWDGVKRWPAEAVAPNAQFWLREGDVVLAMDRPWIEAGLKFSSVRRSDLPALLVQRVARLRGGEDLDTRFLKYVIGCRDFSDYIVSVQTGTVVPHISARQIEGYEYPLPPLPEQRAIAHILGTLDDKIELNRRMNVTLEAMARALFTSWFVDFDPVRAKMEGRDTGLPKHIADLFPDRLVESELGEIPKGWKVGTLEDVASLNPESWSTRNAPEEIVYVDLSNTKWGYIEKVETYPWKAAPSRGRRVLRHGDTIVGTVRPGNGSFSLIGRDGLTGSTGFAVLRPKTPSDAELVWCAATSQDNIDRLAHLADGGAYPAVRPEAVAATKLPLADFATRGAFSSVAAALLNQVDANKQQSHTLADLRDTLLPRLISGEWRAKQIEPVSSISNISPDTTGVQA